MALSEMEQQLADGYDWSPKTKTLYETVRPHLTWKMLAALTEVDKELKRVTESVSTKG